MYFFLMLIGVSILIIGIKRNKKEKVTFTNILHKEEIDIDDIDIVIGELRMEFSSTILELQKDVMVLSEKVDTFTRINQPGISPISIENIEKEKPVKNVDSIKDKTIDMDIEQIEKEVPPTGINIEKVKSPKVVSPKKNKSTKAAVEQIKDEVSPKDYVNENENKNSSKISVISELFDKGFSIDEICEKVQMGRGEILLIKELYLK
jgi:hypothetical protein